MIRTGIKLLPENVRRSYCRTQRADRAGANHGVVVGAEGRTWRHAAVRVQLDIRRQIVRVVDAAAAGFIMFHRELGGRRVNLAEVVDASVGLRGGAGFHEVRNRDGRQKADDGHDDHDFNQRETACSFMYRFHALVPVIRSLSVGGVNPATSALMA